jgi:hypothetical protein
MMKLLVYRKEHDCNSAECTELTAYIRVESKWVQVGFYGSECKIFNSRDLKRNEIDRDLREKQHYIKSQLQQIRIESRERRKTISELSASKSFLNVN